jgi:hypothetical protein
MMMTKAKTITKTSQEPPVKTHKLDGTNPALKYIGGSNYDDWNSILANQAVGSGWYGNNPDAEHTHKLQTASLGFLAGVAFVELQERGFIECLTKGAFSRKVLHATEWRLTFWTCDVSGELPSKAFMRWGRENQNSVSKYPVAGSS